jgi:hypothetical protein
MHAQIHRFAVVALSAIALLTTPSLGEADLVGLYQFNDSNNLGLDTSGNGNHATNVGASFTTAGYQNGAASFDGNDYLRSLIDVNPSVLPQMTWGAWAKPSVATPIRTVLTGDNGGFDRGINIDDRGGGQWSAFTGNGVIGTGGAPSTSEWTFLAVVYSEPTDTVVLYVDEQTRVASSNFGASNPFFDIGHNPDFGEFFVGAIDNVFVYDESFSPSQIADIRVNGFASAVPEPSSSALLGMGLVAGLGLWRRRRTSHSMPTA